MQKSNFKIETSIYDSDLVNSAIKDFEDLVKIEYHDWNLIINNDTDYTIDELFWEFINYVIWLQNENL